jgi:hypothetical protein
MFTCRVLRLHDALAGVSCPRIHLWRAQQPQFERRLALLEWLCGCFRWVSAARRSAFRRLVPLRAQGIHLCWLARPRLRERGSEAVVRCCFGLL